MKKARNSVLFRSFYEAVQEIPDKEDQLEAWQAYGAYCFEGKSYSGKSKWVKLIMKTTVPNIDAANKRYDAAVKNGKKGGRPPENQNNNQNENQNDNQNENHDIDKEKDKENDKDIDKDIEEENERRQGHPEVSIIANLAENKRMDAIEKPLTTQISDYMIQNHIEGINPADFYQEVIDGKIDPENWRVALLQRAKEGEK